MSNEFRDALAAALNPWFVFTAGDGKPAIAVRSGHDLADAILAMPEMQALKDFLLKYAETQSAATAENWNDSPRDVLEAVLGDEGQLAIDWVLGGPSWC